MMTAPSMTQPRSEHPAPDDTTTLLSRARGGDRDALEQLFARQMPLLRRWATGRLPSYARRGVDTSDLVQDTVIATLSRLDDFEPRGNGALQAYLRRAVINSIRSLLRRASSAAEMVELDEQLPGGGPSPLDAAIDGEMVARYHAALARLPALDR